MFGVVIGLGLVIGFSYWCTDFVLMQRALTAHSAVSARKVPLYAGFGKLLFSFLVVMPVVLAGRSTSQAGNGNLDQTAALLMRSLYGSRFWTAGILALIASLMIGLSANVAAFASLWTQEIYKGVLRPHKTERHYILTGRLSSVICILLSLTGAYGTLHFESVSEFILVIFSLTMVPFFAVVLHGIFSRRVSTTGAISGALSGMVMGTLMTIGYHLHLFHLGSELNANFYTAIVSFVTSSVICVAATWLDTKSICAGNSVTSQPAIDLSTTIPIPNTLYLLAGLLLVFCITLNILWR
jgi:SSS family solute:Na+ symporter